MEDYRLEQSGQEVQDILNGAAMQTNLTAENERAELAEQTLQGNIDAEALARENADGVLQGHIDDEETRAKAAEKQNADDIDDIEEKIPTQASSSNQLADKDYVEDLVSTSSATFRGTFNLVSDLHLTVDASYADIAAALGNAIAGADNNDFAFVMIPTSVDTPDEIARIEKYKFNGSVWGFEYVLNNSGFTAAQWAAINSGITSALVTKLGALPSAADLAAALLAKQDKLNFDQAPTPSSTNPVTSGGVYTAIDDEKGARINADAALQQAIEAILLLIPSAATALNQLADKAFVNSSIATATATFRGTFNLVSDLQLTADATHADIAAALLNAISTADNNDYAFVQIPTSVDTPTEIRVTERYKFNGTAWSYEYDLNNSGFTASQWAAINSGITALLVTKLSNLPNATELATMFAEKQNTLTFDNAPVSGSDNPVKSGGLYNLFAAIDAKMPTGASANNKLVAEDRLAAYVSGIINALDATFDLTSTDGHVTLRLTQTDGVIASMQILTSDIASASALTTLGGQVSTNADDIVALQALYNALQQSAPEVIQPSDTWPVANPSDTVIYRVIDRVNTSPQYYSDYMWNGTSMVLMATYNNAIDPRPKKGSANLVTSGGVFDNMGALDVSELNASGTPRTLATYADLSAALAAIPSDYQKGGMSIKFVQTSDNKYVQYNLLSTSFATNASVWQKMDVNTLQDKIDKMAGSEEKPLAFVETAGKVYQSATVGSTWSDSYLVDNESGVYSEIDLSDYVGATITFGLTNRGTQSFRQILIITDNIIKTAIYEYSLSNDYSFIVEPNTKLCESHINVATFNATYKFDGEIPKLTDSVNVLIDKTKALDLYWEYGYIRVDGTTDGESGTDRQISCFFCAPAGSTIKYISETDHSNVGGITFYDKYGTFISGIANNATLGEVATVTAPPNSVFARLSTKTVIIDKSGAVVYSNLAESVKAVGVPENVVRYVSTTGSDTNDGRSFSKAYATLGKAIEDKATTIYIKAGIYQAAEVSVGGVEKLEIIVLYESPTTITNHKPKAIFDNSIEMTFSADADTGLRVATYHTDDTTNHWYRVFVSQDLTPEQSGGQSTIYNAVLWEIIDGVNDRKLKPVLDLQTCNNTNKSFFYDHANSKVYVNSNADGASYFRIRIEEGVTYNFSNINQLNLSDLEFKMLPQWVHLYNVYNGNIKECVFSHCSNTNGVEFERGNCNVIECESYKNAADGFGIANQGQCNFYYCRGHHNYDDGISHHDGATGVIVGGIYNDNGKAGIGSPYSGARVDISGAICRGNLYGVLAGQNSNDVCTINNCVIKGNTIGIYNLGYTLNCWGNIISENGTDISGDGDTILIS
jgi:hypothetical protein